MLRSAVPESDQAPCQLMLGPLFGTVDDGMPAGALTPRFRSRLTRSENTRKSLYES
jgi:hypothetical protein